MKVERVQKTVMSALMATTAVIFATGLALLAGSADRPGAKPGLLIIAGIVGIAATAATRFIHDKSPISPWLVVGVVPAAVGWFFVR
jgi:hypothetical protein